MSSKDKKLVPKSKPIPDHGDLKIDEAKGK